METAEYKNIFDNESSHFFYTANHHIILSLIKKYGKFKQKDGLQILDAGCGTGLLAKKLELFGEVVGVDIHPEALAFSRKRGVKIKKASITSLPFKNDSFDVVTCVDVIYHRRVESDKKAFSELFRVLRPGGILILRVPALKWLKVSHDKYVHTRERYEKAQLRRKILQSGLRIQKLSYVNMLLLPPVILRFLIEKLFPLTEEKSSVYRLPIFLNRILSFILSTESFILPKLDLPIGIGLVAVLRKPRH